MNIIPINQQAPEPGSNLDYALKYAVIGWHVFPLWGSLNGRCRCAGLCKSPAKHPVSHLVPRGQDDATTDQVTIRRWWAQMPEAGIGVFLKPSGLVAIDIDPRNGGLLTMELLEEQHGQLVSDVLAYTQGGGEHRIFLLARDVTINLPGKLGPGVDLKRNGYIAVEPTVGTQGVYSWEASSSPLDGVIPSPLPDWIRDLSSAPVDYTVETASSRFTTPEQVGELRDALAHISSDDRDHWIRFGLALCAIGQAGFDLWDDWSRKSAKYDPVDSMRVWRSFKPGQINFESIFFTAQQAGWINPLAGGAPAPVPVESVKVAADQAVRTPEIKVFTLPGILGQVEGWINATSRKPQPAFAVQAALAFGAAVMGRRYVTTQRNWPSLYFINIGKSASGKEHAKWAVEHLLESCKMERLIGPASYTSNSGVLSALCNQPSHITIIDEFGKTLEAASVKHSARAASAMVALMEAWGRCDGTLRPQGYSTVGMSQVDIDRMNDRSVRNPALTVLAMTTPDSFFDTIGSSAARDGFLNRFLIVESEIGRQAGQHVDPAPVPQAVMDWAHEVHHQGSIVNPDIAPGMIPTPMTVPFSKTALDAFKAFERECITRMDDHDESGLAEMFGRSNEIAMRLSLIVATGCGESVIDRAHADWAIGYVLHHAERCVERLKTSVADSEFEATSNQVLSSIRKSPDGLTDREIHQKCRRFRSLDQRGRMNVLNTMVSTGDISRVEFPPASGRGGKRVAWIAVDTVDKM